MQLASMSLNLLESDISCDVSVGSGTVRLAKLRQFFMNPPAIPVKAHSVPSGDALFLGAAFLRTFLSLRLAHFRAGVAVFMANFRGSVIFSGEFFNER